MKVYILSISLYLLQPELVSSQYVLFYDRKSTWETDFVIKELIDTTKVLRTELLDRNNIVNLDYYRDRKNIIGKNIFVISSNGLDYSKTLDVVKYIQPKVIIHLSDEGGRGIQFNELRHYTSLYLRQHCHGYNYNNANDTSTVYLPLGYISGMYSSHPESISTYYNQTYLMNKPRSYIWAFIGDQTKQDRPYMINAFKHLAPYFAPTYNIPKSNLFQVYSNAYFVPIGLGFVNHDCFRIYEAASSGSIPIIVATSAEINKEMGCHGINFPWLFASTWDDAVSITHKLLQDKRQYQKRQALVIQWWKNKVNEIKVKIDTVLQ